MGWFLRIAALLGLLMLVGMGAYLIIDDHRYSGLGLLALTVPLQWMSVIPARPTADGAPADQDTEPPPLAVLAAIGLSGLCFILAVATRP